MKTNQEIFDIVAKHLLTQMAKSERTIPSVYERDRTECAYRGDNGRKCAAGVLIPDNLYSPEMEGFNVRQDVVMHGLEGVELDGLGLLCELQVAHDTYEPHDWAYRLQDIAEGWRLTFNAAAYGLPPDQS